MRFKFTHHVNASTLLTMTFTCIICSRSFRTSVALASHVRNPGASHSKKTPAPRRSRTARAPVRQARIGPVPASVPRLNETKLTATFDMPNSATADYNYRTVPLSGTNPDTTHNVALPGLLPDARITRVEVEYHGTMSARIRWACVVSDTAPAATEAILTKIVANAGTSSHDAHALLLSYTIGGPPIQCSATLTRVLYFCFEQGAGTGTDKAATFTVNVFVAGTAQKVDHISL